MLLSGVDRFQELGTLPCMAPLDEHQHGSTPRSAIRLDEAVLLSKLASSRRKAQDLIRSGAVMVGGVVQRRPGTRVTANVEIVLLQQEDPWVSRGAWKLLAALDRFGVDPCGRVCLDLGSSTGGFTQVLLARGASRVIALDVGTDQLAPVLRAEPRVDVREGTHILDLSPGELPKEITLVVIDLSFISLTKVFPKLAELLAVGTEVLALVKPQFEVGKNAIKKGVVRDATLREEALRSVVVAAEHAGFVVRGTMESPIEGGEGNREYLAWLTKMPP